METKFSEEKAPLEPEVLSIKDSAKSLLGLAVPIFSQQFLRFFQVLVNFIFVAYIDNPGMLGGLGLGMSFYVIFTMAFFIGFNSGITTFAAQLLGMGKIKETGSYLNSGRIIDTLICIPIFFLLGFSYEILIAIGQDPEIARYASELLRGLIPGVWFIALAILHTYYLNAFHRMGPGNIATVLGVVVQIICSTTFILVLDWGLWGAGFAVSIANMTQCIFMWASLYYYEDIRQAQVMPSFTREQWVNMKEFLGIGAPSMIMACLEIGGVELMQPLAGLISADSSGAQAVVMNIFAGFFTVYLSISIATSIFVGQSIGMGQIKQGRMYTKVSVILISIVTVICILILVLARDKIVALYTTDVDIQYKAIHALAVFCIALVPDSIIYSQMGAFRGLGQQKIAAFISISTLVVLSIPLGCLFAFVCGLDISGFWLGYAVRSAVAAGIFWYLLWYKFDWEEIAKDAQEREEKQSLLRPPGMGPPPGPPGMRGPPGRHGPPGPPGPPGMHGPPPHGQPPGMQGPPPHGQPPGMHGPPPHGQPPGMYGPPPHGQPPGMHGPPPHGPPGMHGPPPHGRHPGPNYGSTLEEGSTLNLSGGSSKKSSGSEH